MRKSEKVNCRYCFETRTTNGINRHEKTCYLNPLNIRKCKVCGNPVYWAKSDTCSYSCSNTLYRSGPNNGNWKESAYQSTCFKHHEKSCVVCSESNIVEVHHLDGNHENNVPENLIPLCPTHHKYWHSRFKPLIEEKVLQYATAFRNGQDGQI